MDQFINSGRVSDIPASFYMPIEPKDRLLMLRKLYHYICKNQYMPFIVDEKHFKIPSNFIISYIEGISTLALTYIHPKYGPISFDLNDHSLIHSFGSFLEYLKDSDLVLSKEQTLKIIENKLKCLE